MLHTRPTARFFETIAEIPTRDWERLLPGEAEDWTYFKVVEQVPPPTFTMGAIAAELKGEIVGVVPVFRTRYELDTSMQTDSLISRLGVQLVKLAPRLGSFPMIGLGSPLSETCHIGLASHLTDEVKRSVFAEILECLARQARRERAFLIAARSLETAEADFLAPTFTARGYARVTNVPDVALELPYQNLDGYLASLPPKTSSYLKRKWRSETKVTIETPDDLGANAPELNALFRSTLASSRVDYGNFGPVHADYFASVLRAMPDRAKITLYKVEGRLLGFQLYMLGRDAAHAKGIGLKYPEARDHNVYFLAWKAIMEDCFRLGIPRISMGGTTFGTKLLMGGRLKRRWIFFRLRNPLLNQIFTQLAPTFDFESSDPELIAIERGATKS